MIDLTFKRPSFGPGNVKGNIKPIIVAMKRIVLKTLLPTLTGIILVLGVLIGINIIFFNAIGFKTSDNKFFTVFVPITTLIALAIQLFITLPVWKQFAKKGKFIGMKLIPFTAMVVLIFGLAFGFVFWDCDFGLSELAATTLTGIGAFTIYWTANLLVLKQIDRGAKK
jgi:hypothetical protein